MPQSHESDRVWISITAVEDLTMPKRFASVNIGIITFEKHFVNMSICFSSCYSRNQRSPINKRLFTI